MIQHWTQLCFKISVLVSFLCAKKVWNDVNLECDYCQSVVPLILVILVAANTCNFSGSLAAGVCKFLVIHQLDVLLSVLHVPQQSLQPPLDLLLILQSAADHHGLKPLVDGDGGGLGQAGGVQGQQPLPAALHVFQQLLHHFVNDGRGLVQGLLLLGVPDGADGDLHRQRPTHQAVGGQLQLFPLSWRAEDINRKHQLSITNLARACLIGWKLEITLPVSRFSCAIILLQSITWVEHKVPQRCQSCDREQPHRDRCSAFLVRSEWTESFPWWTPFPVPEQTQLRVKPPPWQTPENPTFFTLHINKWVLKSLGVCVERAPLTGARTHAGLLLNCTSFPADPNFPGVVRSGPPWTESCWTSCWLLRSFWPVFSLEPWRKAMLETEETSAPSAQPGWLRWTPGRFPNMGFWLPSLAPLRRFPRRREQLIPNCGPGTPGGLETPVQMLGNSVTVLI